MGWILWLAALLLGFWAVARFYLRGEDLSRYDGPTVPFAGDREPSTEHHEVVEMIGELSRTRPAPGQSRLQAMRAAMDAMGDGADLSGITVTQTAIDAGDGREVPGEWLVAEESDPERRLLYLHGGAFSLGSPRSHRPITSRLARLAGAAVLAVDYRLTPENKRLDCLEDCQAAYRWILENGPSGAGAPDTLIVAGDSAGGNLTLAVGRDPRQP